MLKEKNCMCALWTKEIAFDSVPRKVFEWAKRKKGIPGLVRPVMSV